MLSCDAWVLLWLTHIGLPQHVPAFREAMVDGEPLSFSFSLSLSLFLFRSYYLSLSISFSLSLSVSLSYRFSLCLFLNSPHLSLSLFSFFHSIYSGDRTELRNARNFEANGTSKHTELRNVRNFEAHGTSKHTELRNALNFENVFETLMYLIIPEPIL